MDKWLTGNIQFTEMIPQFCCDIRQWENRQIIYSHQGYGGEIINDIVIDDGVKWIPKYPEMQWEEKEYKATITKVDKEQMFIKLDDYNYEFYLTAKNFRHDTIKWKFDIGEV